MRLNRLWMLLALTPLSAMAQNVADRAVGILESRCGQCHGDKSAMAGFRISSRDALLKGGGRGAAVQPGKAVESLLYKAVAHDGSLAMPPGPKLPDSDIEALREWIDKGAVWPEHAVSVQRSEWWAFQKPTRPTAPNAGGRTAIDSFILAKLQKEQIEAAPEATKLALLKRATFDLLGLAPTSGAESAIPER